MFSIPVRYQIILYYCALACVALGTGMHDSTFNNFLSDTFELTADARGHLEFPRELPGFLVVMFTGLLAMLSLTRVGLVATCTSALGLFILSKSGVSYPLVIMGMLGMSIGNHLLMPVGASIVIGLSSEKNRGARLGQAAAVQTLFVAIGTGSVWLFMDRVNPQYRSNFAWAACAMLVGALFYTFMNIPHLRAPRQRLVLRKQYRLYYLVEFLSGARKQIFLTFGPWVLIKVYGLPAPSIAGLLMTSCLIGVVFKPMAGIAMDYFGERTVMILEGIVLALICLGYGYAQRIIPDPKWALRLACCCFILDEMLFALGNARSLYLSRMTPSIQELNSSLAMGVSINHVASMVIPSIAGAIWVGLGYERLFLSAAAFALVLTFVAWHVPRSGTRYERKLALAEGG